MKEHWDSVFNHHIQLLVKDNQALRQELQKLEKENQQPQQTRQEDDPMDTYNGHSPVAAIVRNPYLLGNSSMIKRYYKNACF